MKSTAEQLEAIVAQQVERIAAASKDRPLADDEWDALANVARIVRTLAVHAAVKDDREGLPEGLDVMEVAKALDALRSGKV